MVPRCASLMLLISGASAMAGGASPTFGGGATFESDMPAGAGAGAGATFESGAAAEGRPAGLGAGQVGGTVVDTVPLIDADTAALLAGTSKFVLQQDIKWMETATMGCIAQKNRYRVIDPVSESVVMIVQEESNDFVRCFTHPFHSLLLNIHRTDDGEKLGAQVMTMEREGCCSKFFLGCFACGPGCQDGMVLHAGTVQGKPGEIPKTQAIAHSKVPKWGGGLHPTLQVMDRGVSTTEEPYAVVRGPTFFGGCSELCCKKDFSVSKVPSSWKPGKDKYKDLHVGDAATITKKKPQSFTGAMKQLFTDADTYFVEFKDPSMTPQQKAAMLGSMLLLDYSARLPLPSPAPAPPSTSRIQAPDSRLPTPDSRLPTPGSQLSALGPSLPLVDLKLPRPSSPLGLPEVFFERDIGDKCSIDYNGNVFINISNCYMYGCVCPCTIWIPVGDAIRYGLQAAK